MARLCLIVLCLSNNLYLIENSNITTPTSIIETIVEFNNTVKDPGINTSSTIETLVNNLEDGSTILPIITLIPATILHKSNSNKTIIVSSVLETNNASTTVSPTLSPIKLEIPTISEVVTKSMDDVLPVLSSPTFVATASNTAASTSQPNQRRTNCSDRTPHLIQPVQTEFSRIRKCCPIGETLPNDNVSWDTNYCIEETSPFQVNPIAVTLYDGCIEDNETVVEMEIVVGNLCNRSIRFSEDLDDRLYVIQNGSLLIMDANGSDAFRIYNDYCLDVSNKTAKLDAIVCVSPIEFHINTSQTVVYTGLMMVSIPCLFFVAFIHFAIKQLRTLHGICIGCMSWCLGIGFTLHSISQFSTTTEHRLQYAVQYFILAYYMWMLTLCFNIVLFLWFYVLRYINLRNLFHWLHFVIYFIFTMIIPISLVVYTKLKRIPGMPSYFQQGWSEYSRSAIKSGQKYFIPPVSAILGLCFILLVLAFFGFRKLDEILNTRTEITHNWIGNSNEQDGSRLPKIDRTLANEVQLNARCIALLFIIVSLTWIFEVVTFYSPGASDYLAFLEVMNALQGVFILIIFVVIRNKRNVIASWWHDRGTHHIANETEMITMMKKQTTNN